MNETDTDQNQKPKISKLAIASIICLGLSFVICCSMGSVVVFFYIPIAGIAALIHIGLSKGRLRGTGLAIMSIVIPICLLLTFISMRNLKWYLQRTVYISGLEGIGTAIKLYANEYDGHLPTPQNWCDLLVIQDNINRNRLSGHREMSDAMWGESVYALNKSVIGMNLSDIPGDVVLLFETTYGRTDSERDTPRKTRDYFSEIYEPHEGVAVHRGKDLVYKDRWNQVGGVEILTTEYYLGEECLVLFADGHAELIKKEELDTLRWEP